MTAGSLEPFDGFAGDTFAPEEVAVLPEGDCFAEGGLETMA